MTALGGGTATIVLDATDLKLSHLLLQVGNVFPAIADIRVDSLLDEGVIGGLPHVGRSGYEGLFPLDLAIDRGNELVPVHFGGLVTDAGVMVVVVTDGCYCSLTVGRSKGRGASIAKESSSEGVVVCTAKPILGTRMTAR